MKRNKEEVFSAVKEDNIKSIRLAFCDVFGREKNISITPEELSEAFNSGVPINAAAVKDFGEGIFCDLYLHPEPKTYSILPWQPDNDRIARMFCRMSFADGTPFESHGTKSLLKKAVNDAEEMGYEFYFASELAYYLFKVDENGKPTNEPYDDAGYLDIEPDDKCETIRRNINHALDLMDVKPTDSFHLSGPGQNMLEFGLANPLVAGNNIITAKSVIKLAASKNNAYADFSPKPVPNCRGNGLHIQFAVVANDGNSNAIKHAAAGVLEKAADITAFLNPTPDSYKRLGCDGAPKYISWSNENRSQLIRIPDTAAHLKCAELRSPDANVNPYLAYALIIYASLYGIKNNLELPEKSNFSFSLMENDVLSQYKQIPSTYSEACYIAK
ncbi:MAG: glutamine synthetase, partial [Eubacterium sp.]|nr:glutamine synthetase [Eubacterium sp.]